MYLEIHILTSLYPQEEGGGGGGVGGGGGGVSVSPLQRMASITNSLVSQPPPISFSPNNSKPLRYTVVSHIILARSAVISADRERKFGHHINIGYLTTYLKL